MKRLTPAAIDAAERFVWLTGRLIDRHRFAHLVRGGPAGAVLMALRPYQNPDGGFGNGLEPDIRAPISQPQPVELGLRILDELGAVDDPMVVGACDYLAGITAPGGGVPFVLPSVRPFPRAPWWETADDPPGALNPTAAIAGLLDHHGVRHPWLGPALEFCWRRLAELDETDACEMRAVVHFLDHVRDRDRAEEAFGRVGGKILERGLVALDPDAPGEVHTPLDFAPEPTSLARRLFTDEVIDRHLDALVARQQEDGGWPVNWAAWTPAAVLEWRGWMTVEVLTRLRAYGR